MVLSLLFQLLFQGTVKALRVLALTQPALQCALTFWASLVTQASERQFSRSMALRKTPVLSNNTFLLRQRCPTVGHQ